MPTKFETIEPGQKYAVQVLSSSGRAFRLLVKKRSVPNPSVRGGAYKTEWVAYNGGLYVKEFGETRIEAATKGLAVLAAKGFTEKEV